jgi:chromosome segregation ATPase
MDAIDCDKKLPNFHLFLKEYLNGKVICEDLSAAWRLLGQNIRGIKEIYTLDGNVCRSDGVVSSHGSV